MGNVKHGMFGDESHRWSYGSSEVVANGKDWLMARQISSRRGFASMDKDKQRAIASKGGKAAHAKGTAHEFTPDEARAAGRKGGEAGAHTRVRRTRQLA